VFVLRPHCAGLDIHKKTVSVCRIRTDAQGHLDLQFRTFGTMTADLEALRDWLQAEGIPDVVMESTGCYWKPVWNLLEAHFPLTLANTREVHMLPGRKSDRQDPEWLARLHRCGLIRGCFVPSREQRELQELTRYRTRLIQTRATQYNRIAKTLEGGNIQGQRIKNGNPPSGEARMVKALSIRNRSADPPCPVP